MSASIGIPLHASPLRAQAERGIALLAVLMALTLLLLLALPFSVSMGRGADGKKASVSGRTSFNR